MKLLDKFTGLFSLQAHEGCGIPPRDGGAHEVPQHIGFPDCVSLVSRNDPESTMCIRPVAFFRRDCGDAHTDEYWYPAPEKGEIAADSDTYSDAMQYLRLRIEMSVTMPRLFNEISIRAGLVTGDGRPMQQEHITNRFSNRLFVPFPRHARSVREDLQRRGGWLTCCTWQMQADYDIKRLRQVLGEFKASQPDSSLTLEAHRGDYKKKVMFAPAKFDIDVDDARDILRIMQVVEDYEDDFRAANEGGEEA